MKEVKKTECEIILERIKENDDLIEKLIIYLENNGLLEDFYKKIYYTIEKGKPIYNIVYYKNKDGKLLNLNDINNYNILMCDKLEKCLVYVYDEIKALYFGGYEISKNINRRQEFSKSYDNLSIKICPLISKNNFECFDLVDFMKSNPKIFIYALAIYNINFDELKNIDEKSYTYKKEIKKN